MNIIVLVKQVPDITNIPQEAWDVERGTLKRGMLESVLNPLDLHALTFACQMKRLSSEGRVVCLTMGPLQAKAILVDCLARGADEAVLLSDMKFAGADTAATAYTLAQAIHKIHKEIFQGAEYVVVAGVQSVDGDTAQVPPQVAEELGIEHIAYVSLVSRDLSGALVIERMGSSGVEVIRPKQKSFLLTVTACTETRYRSFHRAYGVEQGEAAIHEWHAGQLVLDEARVGLKGSRTWVARIFTAQEKRAGLCSYPKDIASLLGNIETQYKITHAPADKNIETASEVKSASSYNGEVWVFVEVANGRMHPAVLELLAKARALADTLHEPVAAFLMGEHVRDMASLLFECGADKVYVAESPFLKDHLPNVYKKLIARAVLQYRPQIMLFGATPWGRVLAPRVAYATDAGLTADCTALSIGDHEQGMIKYSGVLKQTRPALGGNIMATILTKDSFCQMASVRPGVFDTARRRLGRTGDIISVPVMIEEKDIGFEIIRQKEKILGVALQGADIIVSGGRGIGSKVDVDMILKPLAEELALWLRGRAEVAGSRMAVEEGFIGHERQVGQTGQTVRPKLYVALGISGAIQHVIGMQGAGHVVAINKDPHARIFQYADQGMVGDLEEIARQLTDAIRRRRS